MGDLFSEVVLIGFLAATIRLSAPILLSAIGQIFTQRSGVLNLGVEGIMIMGALVGIVGAFYTGNPWLGIILGMAVGGLMGLFTAFLSVTLGCDQAISGVGIFLIGSGLSTFFYQLAPPLVVVPLGTANIPLLSEIPVVGPALFQHNILIYLALILVPICGFVLFQTTFGLKIRAVGEKPMAADTLGLNVYRIRYLCVILGGILAGLAGAYLTVGELGVFKLDITAGRGWIAIALVYFGKWNPYRTLVGTLLFGGLFALQIRFQITALPIPSQFLLMLPYILVIVALVMVGRGAYGPASIGRPYKRGEI